MSGFARASSVLLALGAIIVLIGCDSGKKGVTIQTGRVTGQVYAQVLIDGAKQDRALAGAEVKVKGTQIKALTTLDGFFALDGVPVGTQSLIISGSGAVTQEASVQVEHNTTVSLPRIVLQAAQRKWTILVYMNADNDLEPYGIEDINEMEAATASNEVAVLVQCDRSPNYDTSNGNWVGARRYLIQHDDDPQTINSLELQDLGTNVDMGSTVTLQEFLNWGKQAYPSEHYAVIVWNHGSGWRSRTGRAPVWRGISYDDTSRTYLKTVDLPKALASTPPLDIVAMDACLMQMVEIGYQIRNVCNYIAAAEEDVPGPGYEYSRWLDPLVANPAMSPRELAVTMQQKTFDYYRNYGYVTYSVVETAQLPALAVAIDQLAAVLISNAASNATALKDAREQADSYADPDYRDLYHYAELVKAKVSKTSVKTACDGVMAAVNQAVVANYTAASHPNSHGISIFLLDSSSYAYSNRNYVELDLSKTTRWDDWLLSQPQ